jgi:DNA replication protein DnaC
MTDLNKVKPGDSLWIGTHHADRRRIEKVTRLTETQIITGPADRCRYRRKNGLGVNSTLYYITGIATKKDIEEYEAAQQQRREESNRRAEEEKQVEAKRKELNALFNERAYLRKEGDNWIVEFQPMPEAEVRKLAEQVKCV